MALSLSASQQSIQQLFETSEQYVIPDFQRPYLWEYDESSQLYTDLTSAFHRNREEYFLGSVLLARDKATGKLEGIDCMGQNKVTLLEQRFDQVKIYSEALSDSPSDLPLLKWVNRGIAICPIPTWNKNLGLDVIYWK